MLYPLHINLTYPKPIKLKGINQSYYYEDIAIRNIFWKPIVHYK